MEKIKIIFGINELEESITNGNRIVIERFKSAQNFLILGVARFILFGHYN